MKWLATDHDMSALVGMFGFSAAGHLTAVLAANADKRIYTRVDAADDLSCGLNFSMLGYPAFITEASDVYELGKEVSPVGKTKPPVMWGVQAMDDQWQVECSIGYSLLLKDLGVKSSVFISPDGILRGKDGVRQAFVKLVGDVPNAEWKLKTLFADDILFLEWSAESAHTRVEDGIDTFVFRDGLIRVQTVRYTLQHKD